MAIDIDLGKCTIVASASRPGWVDQAVLDLIDLTGGRVVDHAGDAARTVVLVGKDAVRQEARTVAELREVGLDGLSDQGFVLATHRVGEVSYVLCFGGGSKGDAYAVIELIKACEERDGRVFLAETLRREEPFFIRRGIYAHQHWAYAYPYALRTWAYDDWRGYVDLLAYLKINFLSIWSMVGILPDPLTDGDRAYLENYRRVIDYARNRRGMEVFIGECANNVAKDCLSPALPQGGGSLDSPALCQGGGSLDPIERRDYFDVEALMDPSKPDQFERIMRSRRNLYSIVDNADGYWILDSDPGGFKGSPTSEFVDILIGNRELIDECTIKGRDAKLAYWMWCGWGNDDRDMNARRAVEGMRDRLREPWVLFPCWGTHLDTARDLGYIDKSVFFPYGTIEDEPSPPTTRLRFDEMFFHLNNGISMWGTRNAMGNAQSPVVQLPNIFFFAEASWQGVPASLPPDRDVVPALARLVAPDIADVLADGWLMLKDRDADAVTAASDRLRAVRASDSTPRAGPLGRRYFPGLDMLLRDLSLQLDVHSAAMRLCESLRERADAPIVTDRLVGYYEAALKWQAVHQFRRYFNYGPDVNEIAALWQDYPVKALAREAARRLVGKGYSEPDVECFLALTAA